MYQICFSTIKPGPPGRRKKGGTKIKLKEENEKKKVVENEQRNGELERSEDATLDLHVVDQNYILLTGGITCQIIK